MIEANPRASRTHTFYCQSPNQIPYLNIATKVMMDEAKLKDLHLKEIERFCHQRTRIFFLNKFPWVNKELGPEMKAPVKYCFIKDLRDPYFRQLYKERSMHLSK